LLAGFHKTLFYRYNHSDMKQGPLTDTELRQAVYRWVISRGEIPTSNQIAHAAGISKQEVLDGFARLAEAHVLVLQKDGEILMAMPFSAVPTPFLITARGRSQYYANCAWDALGVPVMLRSDGKISSACGCCGTAIHISVRGGALQSHEAIVHFAVPAKHWWDNVVYT
jgi:Alkylmercury lyase